MIAGECAADGGRPLDGARSRSLVRAASSLCAILAVVASDAAATAGGGGPGIEGRQQVEFRGRADVTLDRRVRGLLEQEYLLIHRDSLITRGDTVHSNVIVLDATLRLDGVVLGDLLAVESRVFIRPRAEVGGDVINLAGGLYPSGLAVLSGRTIDEPLATYRVLREPDRFIIEAWIDRTRFVLDGIMGFTPPTYDRVDAVSVDWGAGYILGPFGGPEPELHGRIGYLTGRRVVTGGAEFRLGRERVAVRLGAERTTRSMDDWILGDLLNSVAYLFARRDYRDYYDARRAYLEVAGAFGGDRIGASVGLRAEVERGATVEATHPWTLLRRDRERPNSPISDGTISSVSLTFEGEWQPGHSRLRAGLALEAAARAFGGDVAFGRHVVWGDFVTPTFADQVLEMAWRFQGPLPGTDSLPGQRWSHVGGMGTLPLLPVGAHRGDRLAAVATDYVIPMPEWLSIPVLRVPDLRLQHRVAMAWTAEARPGLEQNVALELRFVSPYFRAITDPADFLDRVRYEFGFAWPLDRRPWRATADSPLLEPAL